MANRLASSTSPYLLQHQNNPVAWWQWGPEAFAEAVARDGPILLSIGYSPCHWFNFLAHASFERPQAAAPRELDDVDRTGLKCHGSTLPTGVSGSARGSRRVSRRGPRPPRSGRSGRP